MPFESNAPMVSVIMPAYNADSFIAAAIRSALEQTVTDLELIVIDDGSQDETLRIVQEAAKADPRVRCCPNDRNMGTARTRNRGLELSRGKYVAFLDSDDIWRPHKLEAQIRQLEESGADLVYSSYAIMDKEGKPFRDFLVPETIDLDGLLKENVIGCSTVMMRRELAEQFRFQADYYHEDYVLWLQILQAGRKMAGIRDILVDYRFYFGSRAGNKLTSAQRRWTVYRKYLKLPVGKSLWYLSHYALAGVKKYKK